MSTANAVRGEISLTLGETDFVLRPSHTAIMAFEEQIGRPLLVLADAARALSLTLRETALIVTECIKAEGREIGDRDMEQVNAAKIGALIHDAGLLVVVTRLALLLFLAATGGYTPEGKRKPGPTTATETPGEG